MPEPVILYRDCPDWRSEGASAGGHFQCLNSRVLCKDALVIARYSALPEYQELERDLRYLNSTLINSYQQHLYIADLQNWYYDLQDLTPRTWSDGNFHLVPEEGPFVLKGATNSRKYSWDTHMWAKNKREAIEVHTRLCEDGLIGNQGVYIRRYVPLETLMVGLRGLPITREYRFFVYKRQILSGGFYWSSHTYELSTMNVDVDPNEVPREFLQKVISKIQNTEICEPPTFYVIDVAKTTSGEWIVIELNDGQMSGLSENSAETLYSNLWKCLLSDLV